MNADVPTLLLMVTVSSGTMAAAMLLLGGGSRQDGLPYWAGALLLGAAGYTLFLLRGRVPDLLSIVLANALLSAMFSMVTAAVQCFQGRQPRWGRLLVAPACMAALMAYGLDSLAMRVVLANLMMAAQSLWVLRCLHSASPDGNGQAGTTGRGALLVTVGLSVESAVLLLRSASAPMFEQPGASLLMGNAVQTLTFMMVFIALLVTSMGFVFMGKDRADQRNLRLAAQDELTGLANRRATIAALEREVARSRRTRQPLALMMVDVDHFKQVNDRHGHLAGDAVLRSICGTLVQRVRAQDTVGRYGGEEFLVVLPDTPRAGAARLAQELCAAVQATPCPWNGKTIAVTVSIGVFGGLLEAQDQWDLLLHAADSALYRAKASGRNRVEVASGLHLVQRACLEADTGFEQTLPPSG